MKQIISYKRMLSIFKFFFEFCPTICSLNVKINASSLKDKEWAEMMINKAHDYVMKADRIERALMKKTEKVIG